MIGEMHLNAIKPVIKKKKYVKLVNIISLIKKMIWQLNFDKKIYTSYNNDADISF